MIEPSSTLTYYSFSGYSGSDEDRADLEALPLIPPPPDLALVLYNDLQGRPAESSDQWCERILRTTSVILAIAGFYFGTALFYRPSSTIEQPPLRITSQIGSVAAGIFPAYYWIKLGTEWMQQRTEEEMRLRLRFRCRTLRWLKNVVDYTWGCVTQFPMAEVAMKYNKSAAAPIEAVATLIANASPTIESSSQLSSWIEVGGRYLIHRFSKDPNRVALLKIHSFILQRMHANIQLGLSMPMEERIRRFQILYQSEAQIDKSQLSTIRELCTTLLREHPVDSSYRIEQPCWHISVSWIIRILMGCVTVVCADFIQTGGMTRDSAHLITEDESATQFLMVLTIISWFYLSMTSPGNVANKVYGQITDLGGVSREKSFSEMYYSSMSKLSDALSVVISWMMVGENYLIAAPYFNQDRLGGRILLAGAVIGCTGYFMDSMSQLAEQAIEAFAGSRFSREEARNALIFKQKCERILEVLSEVSLPDLQQLLDWIGDPELSAEIQRRALGERELAEGILSSESHQMA